MFFKTLIVISLISIRNKQQNVENLLSESEKQNIVKTLQDKILNIKCPMCNNNNFIIADGYFNHPMQSGFQAGIVLGGLQSLL